MSQAGSGHSPDHPGDPAAAIDCFAGTAEAYARYRPPYPVELLDDLRRRAGITGNGRLLDLACGPGRVALPLATCFSKVWAVDQEPEMVAIGREQATRRGLENVRWIVGRAEEIEAAPGSFQLITIGEAFHRLDQRLIAERAMTWLAPGGGLATLGCFSLMQGREPWHDVLRTVVRQRMEHDSPSQLASRLSSPQPRGTDHDRQVLTAFGFEHVGTYDFPHPYVWTLDSILGNLPSTSKLSRRALGNEAERFDADVQRALLSFDSSGRYPETLRYGYSLFRRPRSES